MVEERRLILIGWKLYATCAIAHLTNYLDMKKYSVYTLTIVAIFGILGIASFVGIFYNTFHIFTTAVCVLMCVTAIKDNK